MSKLWLIGLAATAAWTPAAIAQPAPPPSMGHGTQMPAPPMMHPGMHRGMPGQGHMPRFPRIGRGGTIPPHFMAPQFFVHDWRMFGFPAPMAGGHWVRYYDDALLVDRHGRVMDARHGWDWDRRYDNDDRDYDDDYDRDDEWSDDRGGRGHHGKGGRHGKGDRVDVYRHVGSAPGDCRRRCGPVHHVPPPPPHPGYGYGYGYGQGYGYGGCGCGPVVVTETITTTAPVVETHTYYETVTEYRAAPRRHYAKPVRHYAKPVRRFVKPVRRAPPPPRPGERG